MQGNLYVICANICISNVMFVICMQLHDVDCNTYDREVLRNCLVANLMTSSLTKNEVLYKLMGD